MKEMDKKYHEWKKRAEEDNKSWTDTRMKTTEELEKSEEEGDDDTLSNLSGNWLSRLAAAFRPMGVRVEKAVRMATSAECNLERWQMSKCYLKRQLERQIVSHKRQKSYLESCREDLSERKSVLVQSLLHIEQLNALSRNDFSEAGQQCKDALTKCENGIRECSIRIQRVKEEKRTVKVGSDRVAREEGRCCSIVIDCTSKLEHHCDRLQQEIKKRLEELNSDGYLAKAARERYKEESVVSNADTVGGFFKLAAITLFTGGVGLAATETLAGAKAYREAREERDKEIRKLKTYQDELDKCDAIIRRCKHEVAQKVD